MFVILVTTSVFISLYHSKDVSLYVVIPVIIVAIISWLIFLTTTKENW